MIFRTWDFTKFPDCIEELNTSNPLQLAIFINASIQDVDEGALSLFEVINDKGRSIMTYPENVGKLAKMDDTAANYCKVNGTTLTRVSEVSGKCMNTLRAWHKDNPNLFRAVVYGVSRLYEVKV